MFFVHPGRQPAGGKGANRSRQRNRGVDPDSCLTSGDFVGTNQKERLERGDTVPAKRGNGGASGHQPECRLAHQLMDCLLQASPLLFLGFRRVCVAARGFLDRQFEDKGDQQARKTDNKKGGAPVKHVGDPAANQVCEHGAQGDAHGIETQRLGSLTRNKVIRNQGVGRRRTPCLADAHANAADQQNPECPDRYRADSHFCCKTAGCGHQRPECNADGHDPDTMADVGKARQRNPHGGVEQGKAKAGKQAKLGVGDFEIRYQVRTDDCEQRAVDEIKDVDQG